MLWLALGCGPLLPEHVFAVPGQLPSERLEGEPGFGAAMAWVHGDLAVAGDGQLHWRGVSWPMEGVLSIWPGTQGPVVARQDGVFDVQAEQPLFEGRVDAAHGDVDGFVVASRGALIRDGESAELQGVRRLWVQADQLLLLRCAGPECWVELDGERLGAAEEDSALGFFEGHAVWGAPASDALGAPGAIVDRDGPLLEGVEGEHLGRALCGEFAAGVHNLLTLPNQSRTRSLAGGSELAIESGREGGAMILACEGDHLAVSQPTWLEGGRVWVFELPLGG